MTRLAVLGDIHGNSVALEAVLADLERQGGADMMVLVGDLAVFGPDPCGVLELLRTCKPIFYLRGNTDRYLLEGQYPTYMKGHDWQSQILASFPWTAQQLGAADLEFLANLPVQQLLPLSPDHLVLAVHGSPRSDEEGIRWNTPDEELVQMLQGASLGRRVGAQNYDLLFCAHTHVPLSRRVGGRLVINTGSVGLPFDGDPRASYIIVTLQSKGYQVEQRRVPYDIEAVISQLINVDHPNTVVTSFNLRTARPLSQGLIYTERMRLGAHQLAA